MGWETWGSQESWDAWEGGGAAPVPTYGVSGVLTNERDAALVGKTITLNTTGTTDALDSVVSGAGGAYAFTGVVAGSYDLLVDDVPYLGGATVNVVASNITQDFQASNTGVPVQGYVLDGGGLSIDGVLVTASGQVIDTQTTDGSGFYEFETGDATFTLTPTKDNYEFAPVSREVVVFGEPVTVTNFVGTELYSIFGAILDSAGVPLDGVTVTLSGDASDSVETAAGAPYEFNGLSNGNYTVTPTLAGSTFSPDHIDVVVADGDESIADMQQVYTLSGVITQETFTISGTIKDGADAGIEGVTVALSGDASDSVLTDGSGNYSFTDLDSGSYTVTPTLTNYEFVDASENVSVSGDDVVVDDMVGAPLYQYNLDWNDETIDAANTIGTVTGATSAVTKAWNTLDSYTPAGLTKCLQIYGTPGTIQYEYTPAVAPPTDRAVNVEYLIALQNTSGDFARSDPAFGLWKPSSIADSVFCSVNSFAQNMNGGAGVAGVYEYNTSNDMASQTELQKWLKIRITYNKSSGAYACTILRASTGLAVATPLSYTNTKLQSLDALVKTLFFYHAPAVGGEGYFWVGRIYIGDATLGWPSDT